MLSRNQLKQQLTLTEELIEKLKPYSEREISQLPDDLKNKLSEIKIGFRITSSGLETVKIVLKNLSIVQYYLKQAVDDPKLFERTYANYGKKVQQPQSKEKIKPQTDKQLIPASQSMVKKQVIKPTIISSTKPFISIKPKIEVSKPVIKPETPVQKPEKPVPVQQPESKPHESTPPPSSQIEL